MPGVFGFVRSRGSGGAAEDPHAFLARMARALEHEERFETALHVDDEQGAGLGRVGLRGFGSGGEIAWNGDRTCCAVVEGELYDTEALERTLPNRASRAEAPDDARLILDLRDSFGLEFLSKLNGAFVAAIWDRTTRELTVFNDRLGLFPLYYARASGGLLFASGVRALLADPAVSRSVDRVAINQFMVFDHVLGDRTLLEAARLLPQASVLTFRDGALAIRPYWTLRYPTVYDAQSEEHYVDQFVSCLRRAVVRQQADGRSAAVLLSGGLDSRLLLAPLCEAGAAPSALTFGIRGCDDERVAAEVAAALKVPCHAFELTPDWLRHLAGEAVRLTDGLGNIVNLHALATLEDEARHAEVLYKGFLGDALFGFALKRQMWADYERCTSYDVHLGVYASQGVLNYDRAGEQQLFTDAFRMEVGDGVYEAYRQGMDRARVAQLANQRLYFDLTQRVPRMTLNGVEVARSRAIVRLPFADNDLVEFALTVPPGFMFERRLQKAALERYYPRLARIPLAGTGRTLSACWRDLLVQARTLLDWHLRARGLGWLASRAQRPYKDYNGWFRATLRPWVEELLLDRRAVERGYFNPEYVRRLVSEHVAGANHATRLGALLTVELWHRQFIDCD